MTSSGADSRTAYLRITDAADPSNINSGVFSRGLTSSKITDYGIGSIVYIFDVSSYSGNRTYNLEHSFSNTARTLTTNGTIVAIGLSNDLKNAITTTIGAVTMTNAWTEVTGTGTSALTTTAAGGFYVSASIESYTSSFNTESLAEWKLQYKKGSGGVWTDLSSRVERSMSASSDKGLISLVGALPDASSAGDYYFRVAHIRVSATSTIETTNANLVAVALGVADGCYPVFKENATGVSNSSATLANAVTATMTPSVNTNLLIHAQYGITGNAAINAPAYDLFVDNSIFNGNDQMRSISSSADKGAGASVGLAQNLLSGTEYQVSLRHASDGTNTTTTNDILLTGFGLTLNSGPLPIELISFSAIPKETRVDLAWQTAMEIDNDYFTIERSKNGEEWTVVQKN